MAKAFTRLNRILQNVAFPDVTFQAVETKDEGLVALAVRVNCAVLQNLENAPDEAPAYCRWFFAPDATEQEVVVQCFRALREVMDDLLRRDFLYRETNVFLEDRMFQSAG